MNWWALIIPGILGVGVLLILAAVAWINYIFNHP